MTINSDFRTPDEPWDLFKEWFDLASQNELNDHEAMSLATVDGEGRPSVRIVLLKDYDVRGFCFFTNRQSRKGEQLTVNPVAALCWHWKSLRRQVRAEGKIVQTSDEESDLYFATRPRGSQIGAWASQQSRVLDQRSTLEQRQNALEKDYEGKAIPRPPYWGGYRLVPTYIEFWQDREFRLHDRILYTQDTHHRVWTKQRLYP